MRWFPRTQESTVGFQSRRISFFFPPSPPSSMTSHSITAPSKVWKHTLTYNNELTIIRDCGSILHVTLMAPNKSYREEPFIIKVLTTAVLVLRSSKPKFFIFFWLSPAPSSSFTVIQTNMGFLLEPAEEIDYDKCLFYCWMDVWHQSLNTFLSLCIWAIFIISHFKCLPFRAFSFLMTPLHTHSHPRIPATTPDSSTFPVISQHQEWSELQQGLVLQLLLGSFHRRNHHQQQHRKQ